MPSRFGPIDGLLKQVKNCGLAAAPRCVYTYCHRIEATAQNDFLNNVDNVFKTKEVYGAGVVVAQRHHRVSASRSWRGHMATRSSVVVVTSPFNIQPAVAAPKAQKRAANNVCDNYHRIGCNDCAELNRAHVDVGCNRRSAPFTDGVAGPSG